ncbi:MAG: class I SAM-dependent methyltransferase, partial [Burkholderiaceae bacterium]|nr:class I SAM-dependent methyltransferase [Burkholderiaceae bacterium]
MLMTAQQSTHISAQSQVFLAGEADRYFKRNESKYSGAEAHQTLETLELALNLLEKHQQQVATPDGRPRALEVGCANGFLLNRLCARLNCDGYGIDPSSAAIQDGQQRFPFLQLCVGTAEKLPYEDRQFDYVLLGAFLPWLPETHYLSALAEANRVMRPGGFLILIDFDHPNTNRRKYAHHPDVLTFRHRALDVLLATRMYSIVAKWPVGLFARDPLERLSLSIFYREPDAYPLLT